LPAPPNFADPCPIPDNVASLGIPGYEINEGLALVIAPNIVGLALESERLDGGYGVGQHPPSIRQWRSTSRKMLSQARARRFGFV
jgi:hypothetical protein